MAVDNAVSVKHLRRMAETPAFSTLATALRERRDLIADREFYARDPAAHLAALQAVSEKITARQAELPQAIDPQLAHYLQRCSYDKALAFLEDAGS